MADTNFTNGVTLTDADWFNDVNRVVYTICGDPATSSAMFSNIKQPASDSATGVVEYAVQSEMETGTSNTLAVTPGRQHYHPGHPKGWGRFTSTSTVASYPAAGVTVSSESTGVYTVTHGLTFSSSDAYACTVTPIGGGLIAFVNAFTVSSMDVRFINDSGAAAAPTGFSYVVYGDL